MSCQLQIYAFPQNWSFKVVVHCTSNSLFQVSLVPTNKMGRRSAGYVIFSGLNVRLCELFDAGNV